MDKSCFTIQLLPVLFSPSNSSLMCGSFSGLFLGQLLVITGFLFNVLYLGTCWDLNEDYFIGHYTHIHVYYKIFR